MVTTRSSRSASRKAPTKSGSGSKKSSPARGRSPAKRKSSAPSGKQSRKKSSASAASKSRSPSKSGSKSTRPSAAKVKQLKLKLAKEREELTLVTSPVKTITLFLQVSFDYLVYVGQQLRDSRTFWAAAAIAGLIYGFLRLTGSPFADEVDAFVLFTIWWVGLGILSSVGLGSGMHSGILFLFPHMFRVVSASNKCPSMNFVSKCDMWWGQYGACELNCLTNHSAAELAEKPPFMSVVQRVLFPAFFW